MYSDAMYDMQLYRTPQNCLGKKPCSLAVMQFGEFGAILPLSIL